MEENIRLKQAGSLPLATEAVESETILAVDASGNMNRVPVDAEPAENSNKLVKSGGVARAIALIYIAIQTLKNWVTNGFAKIDGWYSTLVSGAAENLVGRGSVPAEYTFRTSGGTADIGTGTATIDVLKGKTILWNQLFNGVVSSSAGLTITIADGVINIDGTSTSAWTGSVFGMNPGWIEGHKYLVKPVKIGGSVVGNPQFYNGYNSLQAARLDTPAIYEPTGGWGTGLGMGVGVGAEFDNLKMRLQIFDLTAFFGAGNEPSIIGDFLSLYPEDAYDYSAPVFKNNSAKGIKTFGFNTYNSATGEAFVFGGKQYQITGTYTALAYSDGTTIVPDASGLFTPTKNDILSITGGNESNTCVHLVWSGYRNGEYEPYEEHTLLFNGESGSLATLTGKKIVDGEPTGESVTIFPEGWKSVGTAYDFGKADSDGYIRKVTKCIDVRAYEAGDDSDASVITDGTNTYYVLATPEEYLLDTPIPATYVVNDFGTEQRLPEDTASSVMAPIFYDVKYAMNAVDTLRRLPVNYISKASMDNFTTELAGKLGTAMNATIAITPTYDAENAEYDYEITITPNEP